MHVKQDTIPGGVQRKHRRQAAGPLIAAYCQLPTAYRAAASGSRPRKPAKEAACSQLSASAHSRMKAFYMVETRALRAAWMAGQFGTNNRN